MAFIELGVPAWKADYTRAADVQADWKDNKEFVFHEGMGLDFPARYGQATTRAELKELVPASTNIVIRYKRQESLTTVKL